MIPSTVGFASPRLLRNLDVKNQGNPILKFHHSDTRLSRVGITGKRDWHRRGTARSEVLGSDWQHGGGVSQVRLINRTSFRSPRITVRGSAAGLQEFPTRLDAALRLGCYVDVKPITHETSFFSS
jgi:hypothetical protein